MALGWDLALADAAVALGVPFDAYVPHEGQSARWNARDRARYDALLAKARRIVLVSPGPYAPTKMHVRNAALVRDSQGLLALWDGGADGGTYGCLADACRHDRPWANLWASWRRYAA